MRPDPRKGFSFDNSALLFKIVPVILILVSVIGLVVLVFRVGVMIVRKYRVNMQNNLVEEVGGRGKKNKELVLDEINKTEEPVNPHNKT